MLNVGTNKHEILKHLKRPYLLVDDGDLIDAVPHDPNHTVTVFDVATSSFDPLSKPTYAKAVAFTETIDALFTRGDGTLTKETGLEFILDTLLTDPKPIAELIPKPDKASLPGHVWAYGKMRRICLSPVLKDVLTRDTNMSFKGTIHVRLDPKKIVGFDRKVIANFLISQYHGLVVITEFGFYGHKGHAELIRQKRLVAGINSFDELPEMQADLLLIKKKFASRCTFKDAETLAPYLTKHLPHTDGYDSYIKECMA